MGACLIGGKGLPGVPDDAEPVEGRELDEILHQIQGEWRIIPIRDKQPSSKGVVYQSQFRTKEEAYGRAVVKGDVVVLSSPILFQGRPLPAQEQALDFYRDGEGTLYIDEHGSIVTKFAPQRGVLEIENYLGQLMEWRRPPGFGGGASATGVADEIARLYALQQQGALSQQEFQAAKQEVLQYRVA